MLTHERRWRPVIANYAHKNADGYIVAGGGHRGLVTSENHRLYGRRNRNPQRTRNLEPATWVGVDDVELGERYYLASPTRFPELPVPEALDDAALMWVVGRYVADGHLTYGRSVAGEMNIRGRVHIITDSARVDAVAIRLEQAGLRPTARQRAHNGTWDVEFSSTALARLIEQEFGRHADGKKMPPWLLGARRELRDAFLEGYLSGDGHWDQAKERWIAGTASKSLAVSLRLLGQTLDYTCSLSWVDVKPNEMCAAPLRSWRVTMSTSRRNVEVLDRMAWQKVRSATPIQDIPAVYDLTVEEDHSYIADGIVSHNQHPRFIEMDEAQDYPDAGWVELTETLRFGDPRARWRAHGVSRGVRDQYYKKTQSKDWYVHRFTAIHRPDWTDEERRQKAEEYGSRDHPDYRRNILGMHGDALSSLFVLSRLMACVDSRVDSTYNTQEYHHVRITDEFKRDSGLPIRALLDLPGSHKKFQNFWIGMDVGMTNHPTEILVWAEDWKRNDGKVTDGGNPTARLRCIARIHLERISALDQLEVMDALADFYKPIGFGMDRTGLGLPVYQTAVESTDYGHALKNSLKGYNFSEKIAVGFEAPSDDPYEELEDRQIMGNVLEYSSDQLRLLVDQGRLVLPWDVDMLREFQGQAYYTRKDATNPYGRKEFNKGKFHALDAARMAILAYTQHEIETLLKKNYESREVVFVHWATDVF